MKKTGLYRIERAFVSPFRIRLDESLFKAETVVASTTQKYGDRSRIIRRRALGRWMTKRSQMLGNPSA